MNGLNDLSNIHVLALVPPGGTTDVAIMELKDDVVQGATEGFEIIIVSGEQIVKLLELFGFLGDTLGLNAMMSVFGHNSHNNCHLCSYFGTKDDANGGRYAKTNRVSSSTSFRRTDYRHACIQKLGGVSSAMLREIGIKPKSTQSPLALDKIAYGIRAKEHLIPTADNKPVMFSSMDSIQACLISPDHLRDALNLLYFALKKKTARRLFETFIIDRLVHCGLPVQRKLFHAGKNLLHTMSVCCLRYCFSKCMVIFAIFAVEAGSCSALLRFRYSNRFQYSTINC